jgi:thiosulfate/3-mercaptopyruvate sulfurtransferase
LKKRINLLAALLLSSPVMLKSGDMTPIVTTDWLLQNLANPGVVILDIRSAAKYEKGHIPGSLNTPFSSWTTSNNGLSIEVPSDQALRDLLGKSGINPASLVVVVTGTETDFSRADATRVAWTCMLAGLRNVGVLDGGYNKWVNENRTVSTDLPQVEPTTYSGTIDRSMVVSKNYVLKSVGKSVLADTRLPQDYFGITSKVGHIQSAVDLPTPWVFARNGTFVEEKELQSMAAGVVGTNKSKEIIVYCEVGGYASTWWFLLTQILGYQNVKIYDGSLEEWIKDPNAPLSQYSWH